MALTVNDLDDFLTALREHPEWRDQVRDEIMAEDMRALPGIVRQLGERIDQLGERVDQLAQTFEARFDLLDARMSRVEGRLGNLEGWRYEAKFNAPARLGRLFRRVRRIELSDLDLLEQARDALTISDDDWEALASLDAVFRARLGLGPEAAEVIVALEISVTVDETDVTRARSRADILARAGYKAVAVAGGRIATPGARDTAEELDVQLLIDRSSDEGDAA
jgi:hypothetical protein